MEEKVKNNTKKSKVIKIVVNAAFFSLLSFMVMIFVWNFVDIRSGYKYPVFGMRTSVIVSPSMATVNSENTYITSDMKQIQTYDVVTTVNYKNYEAIQKYDIVTYYTGSKNLVCHRVVDKYVSADGVKYVVLRGDANDVNDAPVSYDLIRGKVVSITPNAGHIVAFIQSPYLFIALFGSGFFVALAIFIMGLKKDKQEAVKQEQAPAQVPLESLKEEPKVQREFIPSTNLIELEPIKEENFNSALDFPPLEKLEPAPKKEEKQAKPEEE